jgi:hypothetical protein
MKKARKLIFECSTSIYITSNSETLIDNEKSCIIKVLGFTNLNNGGLQLHFFKVGDKLAPKQY